MRMSGATSTASGSGSRMPHCPALKRRAEFPGAHDQRLAAPGNRRQRELRAGIGELAQEWDWIDLGLHRHEAGDDGGGRYLDGKPARGNRLRRALTLRRQQRVAQRQGFGAQGGFCLSVISVRSDIDKSAEPRRPSEYDPGNLHK